MLRGRQGGVPQPAITVGVPCWNVEGYVGACLASLVGQSFGDLEIVAIDDGSSDGTGRVLDGWAERDGRVRVVHRRHMGLGSARNEILRLARGRYVTFVDSDDWLAPGCLEKAERRARESDLDVVSFGWVRIEDGSGRAIGRRCDHNGRDMSDVDGLRRAAFSAGMNLMSCARLVRSELFHDHDLFYPDVPHEDLYVTPFLFLYGQRFGYVDEELYCWRMREGSITNVVSRCHIDGILGVFSAWKARLCEAGQFDDFRDSVCAGVLAYCSTLLRRIERTGNPELLCYLRDRVRSTPEIGQYLRDGARPGYLSPYRRWKHAKAVAFLEGGGRFSLPTVAGRWLKGFGGGRKAEWVGDGVFSSHRERVVATVPGAGQSAGAGRGLRGGASTQVTGTQGGAARPGAGG